MCFNEIPSHVFVRVLDNLLFNFQRPIAARRTFGVPATFPLYHAFLPLSIPFLYFFQSFFGFFIGFFARHHPKGLVPFYGCFGSISSIFPFVKKKIKYF